MKASEEKMAVKTAMTTERYSRKYPLGGNEEWKSETLSQL